MAGEVLAGLFNERNNPKTPTDRVLGVVTSTSPLKIKIENRLEIDSNFLTLMTPVKELKIPFNSHGESHTITVFENLKAGEQVVMLAVSSGQHFIVLDRM